MDVDQLFSRLFRLKNLDIWEGLNYVGCNKEVYADILRLFLGDLEKKSAALEGFLKQEDWKKYYTEIHALKGGLAGIGAWELSEKAGRLEDAARKENYRFCLETSGEILEEMGEFAVTLKAALFSSEDTKQEKSGSGEQYPRKQVSLDFLAERLNELYIFCSSGDSIKADALVNKLKNTTHSKDVDIFMNEIYTYVKNLDYDPVIKLLADKPYIHTKRPCGTLN